MSFNSRYRSRPDVLQNKPIKLEPEIIPIQNDSKRIKWGPPTWFLFHTLAHKIKEDSFNKIKNDFLANIISICKNLPCPKCADHASEYINKININAINSKDDLKNMLFSFHNEVNQRTGSPQFSYAELNDKYSKAVTINIIQNFFIFFQDKTFNVSTITNSMHRGRLINVLKTWFTNNLIHFDN